MEDGENLAVSDKIHTSTTDTKNENVTNIKDTEDQKICKKPQKPESDIGEGIAHIKAEFIDYNHKRQVTEKYLTKEAISEIHRVAKHSKNAAEHMPKTQVQDECKDSVEPPQKKQKLKGRNKKRPKDKRTANKDKLCPSVVTGEECTFADKCRFCHDIQAFIDGKPKSLGEKCYLFETFGKCRYGVACMYFEQHTVVEENFRQVFNEDKVNTKNEIVQTTNNLQKESQVKLWKKTYDFTIAEKCWKTVEKTKLETPIVSEESFCVPRPSVFGIYNQNSTKDSVRNKCDINSSSEALNKTIDESASVCNNKLDNSISKSDQSKLEDGKYLNKKDCSDQEMESKVVAHSDENLLVDIETEESVINMWSQEKVKIDFRDKLYLAPLTTVGNLPFRRICKQFGADITCSEMATGLGLLQGHRSEWALLRRHHTENLFGAQVCGAYPDLMTRVSQVIMENTDVDFIDINSGCPIDLFYRKGEGCGLLGKTTKLYNIVRSMQGVMNVPITVKMRTGINEGRNISDKIMVTLKNLGVSMVTLHGRSREQRYNRLADWDYIQQCAKEVAPMPVFGNGDILSYEDYNLHCKQTNVAGCMIARGALMKPWIFTEIKEQRHWDISAQERFEILKDFTNFGLEHWGSDIQGVQITRRFLLEWLSFLYRYIPVGILEKVPQKINEKPPYYVGRNDLETMMASSNCADWIKLSEMLLGPVQDGFQFLPKHKANSFQ